jgi:hypothetical protein
MVKSNAYLSTLPQDYKIEPVIAAVDYVSATKNCFKVYIRQRATRLPALYDRGSCYRRYSRQGPRALASAL